VFTSLHSQLRRNVLTGRAVFAVVVAAMTAHSTLTGGMGDHMVKT
jgi:hypothetical protein